MQYNKQLFIGDYWIFSCIYQLFLPGSLFVSIRFVVLITSPLSLFHWSLPVHRWDIREKSKKLNGKPSTFHREFRVWEYSSRFFQ